VKLSFSTLGCPEWYWSNIVSAAKDLGFQGVEVRGVLNQIHVPRVRQFTAQEYRETLSELNRLQLGIPCFTSSCELDAHANRNEMLQSGREYVDVAARMQVPCIRLLGDREPAPDGAVDTGRVKESLLELAEYAEKTDVTLLVETNGWFADTGRLAKLLQEVNRPNVAALWDVHHPYRFMGEPPETTVQNLGGLIRHVHVKDSILSDGKVRYMMMGQGDVPVGEAVGALEDGGYDGFYSLEWVKRWDLTLEAPGIAFAQYAQYMRAL
jgi:fatty-acyl-CoA synthase